MPGTRNNPNPCVASALYGRRMRPQAPHLAVTYTGRDALEHHAFREFGLLDIKALGKASKARGINLSIFESSARPALEALDAAGAFRPIYVETAGGELIFSDETPYVPWEQHGGDCKAFYSHWQLLYLEDAIEMGRVRVDLDWLLDESHNIEHDFPARPFYEQLRTIRGALHEIWWATTMALVRMQNRFGPSAKGTLTKNTASMEFDHTVGDFVDLYTPELQNFDAQQALGDLGVTVEQLKQVQRFVSMRGNSLDPIDRWFMLFRMTPFKEREKMKGSARQAQDAYDAAHILGRFVKELTGEIPLGPDEIFDISDKSWKRRLYGRWPIDRFNRNDLRVALESHQMWPHLVNLFVEGETEEIVCTRLLKELSGWEPADLGVTFARIDGVGNLWKFRDVIRLTKGFVRWSVVATDKEGNAEKDIETLIADGTLAEDTTHVWETSFEEANFTDAELVAVVHKLAAERDTPIDLTSEEFRAECDNQRAKGSKKGAAEILLSMARHPERGSVILSKLEVAGSLTQILIDDWNERGEVAADDRPLLQLIVSIVRIS
jgi:hypothetical protein